MFNLASLPIQLLAAASCVLASPVSLNTRAVINHDAIIGFPQAVPSGIEGTLMLKYQPYLKVFNGCVPFPAVNAAGDVGAGLSNTGSPEGGCSSSPGQVYARAKTYKGAYAIMYSWYMPKDSPSTNLGHRHEWENAVVWLDSASTTAKFRGVAISAHGGYQKDVNAPRAGDKPKIGYMSVWPVNHQLIATDSQGGVQPLIAWGSMTAAARKSIETYNFDAATPSFRDSNFDSYLEKAFM